MAFVLTSSDEEPGPKTFDEFYKALQSRFFRFEKRPDAAGAPPSTDAQPATPAAAAAGSGSGSAAGTDAATPPSTDSPAAVEQPEACMLCSDRVADAKIGSRLCKCDARSACEGPPCGCSSILICAHCLAMHLWSSTNSAMRSQWRFRAKCPFCKAEYCHIDMVVLKSASRADVRGGRGRGGRGRGRKRP